MEKYQVWSGGRKSEKKAWPRAFIVFPTGKAWQGGQNSLVLASLDNVVGSGLWVGLRFSGTWSWIDLEKGKSWLGVSVR